MHTKYVKMRCDIIVSKINGRLLRDMVCNSIVTKKIWNKPRNFAPSVQISAISSES